MSEWNLVADRKPERPGTYIVAVGSSGITSPVKWDGECWYWFDSARKFTFPVVAWMEFPQPFTPEESKKSPSAATEKGDTEITKVEYHGFEEKAMAMLFKEINSYMDKAIAKGKEEGSAWEYQSCVAPYYSLQDFIKNLLLDYLINGLGEK